MDNINPLKKEAQLSIAERIKKYKDQQEKVKDFLNQNPNFPYEQMEADKVFILKKVEVLKKMF